MENCHDCSVRPRGPGGHAALVGEGPVNFRQCVFRCSACGQAWRRHNGGADTHYWGMEEATDPPDRGHFERRLKARLPYATRKA